MYVICICIYIYIYAVARAVSDALSQVEAEAEGVRAQVWHLQDIVITNIVWCIAYKREVGRGVLYCVIIRGGPCR